MQKPVYEMVVSCGSSFPSLSPARRLKSRMVALCGIRRDLLSRGVGHRARTDNDFCVGSDRLVVVLMLLG